MDALVEREWPQQIAALMRDANDRPVPRCWALFNRGRMERPGWMVRVYKSGSCWVCGRKLGRDGGFLLDAAGVLVGLSREPPAHSACLAFPLRSVHWSRGVMALWVTHRWEPIHAGVNAACGNVLPFFVLTRPTALAWFGSDDPAEVLPATADDLRRRLGDDVTALALFKKQSKLGLSLLKGRRYRQPEGV